MIFRIKVCIIIYLSSRLVRKLLLKMAKRTRDERIDDEDDSDSPISKKGREESSTLAKIFDGTYFTVIEHDNDTRYISAKCMKCIKEKIIRGQSSSTGNFYQHYIRVHTDNYVAMKEYCDERASRKKEKRISITKQTVLHFSMGSIDPLKVHIREIYILLQFFILNVFIEILGSRFNLIIYCQYKFSI